MLYHGTSLNHLHEIMLHGLQPNASSGADKWARAHDGENFGPEIFEASRGFVFLTRRKDIARWFAEMAARENNSAPVVLCVSLPDYQGIDEDEHSEPFPGFNPMEAYRHVGPIEPKALSIADISGMEKPAPLPGEGYADF